MEDSAMLAPGSEAAKGMRAAAGPPDAATPVIAIGSSTGGVDALHAILSAFPEDCPATLVVQHMSGPFTAGFAKGLARSCRPRVRLAEPGMPIEPGHIYIAPGNSHHLTLALRRLRSCNLVSAQPVCGHRPSIDVLFRSCLPLGRAVRAALLTGMGRDGAEGMLAIRRNGGRTVAQDRETSVVFGMARVARELGGVEKLLPLNRIAAALIEAGAEAEGPP